MGNHAAVLKYLALWNSPIWSTKYGAIMTTPQTGHTVQHSRNEKFGYQLKLVRQLYSTNAMAVEFFSNKAALSLTIRLKFNSLGPYKRWMLWTAQPARVRRLQHTTFSFNHHSLSCCSQYLWIFKAFYWCQHINTFIPLIQHGKLLGHSHLFFHFLNYAN